MRLRVLFAIHGPADDRTAVYNSVDAHVEYLRGQGHRVDLLTSGDLRRMSPRLDPVCLPPALAFKGLSRYDVAVFHSYLGSAFHALRPLLDPGRRTATVTSFHGLEPLYYRALAAETARQGRPLSARYRLLHGRVMPRLLRASCRASDAVFCLNSTEARHLVAEGWAATDRVHVLANGVEPEAFVERIPRAAVRELLFVGQWLPAKGIRYLVEAFTELAAIADVRLTCLGTGAAADVVTAAFPDAVRGRVRVVPSAGRAQVFDALRAADLFVFPTLSEGFSKALLEGMAAGLPVVATTVGAAPDILRDGHDGQLAQPADAAAIVGAVLRYIRDPDMAARHGAAARSTAEAYRLDAVRRQWAERLYHVVDRHARDARGVERRRGVAV
jgi:glycosyltransferase involved in cell wall biosynthesis